MRAHTHTHTHFYNVNKHLDNEHDKLFYVAIFIFKVCKLSDRSMNDDTNEVNEIHNQDKDAACSDIPEPKIVENEKGNVKKSWIFK